MNDYLNRLYAAYQGEMEAYNFYSYLASVAPSSDLSQIIGSIARDEYGHARTIWAMLASWQDSGSYSDKASAKGTISFEEGIRKAIDGELGDMSEYADLARIAPNTAQRLTLLSIAGDEYGHARTFNVILCAIKR